MKSTSQIFGTIALSILLGSATSHAQDLRDKLYVHTDLGPAFIPAVNTRFNTLNTDGPDAGIGKFKANPGIRGDLSLGLNLTKSWAVELQTGAIWNPGPGPEDNLYQIPVMLNALYHLNFSDHWRACVGVGGGEIISMDQVALKDPSFRSPFELDSTAISAGAQGQAGITYSLSRHLDIGLEYKLLWVNHYGYHFDQFPYFESNINVNNLLTHSALLSLTWRF